MSERTCMASTANGYDASFNDQQPYSSQKASDDMNDAPERRSSDEKDPAPGLLKRVSTKDLMSGQREIIIVHDDKEYRLRITQLGKLILTR